jgi:hypothetical protein
MIAVDQDRTRRLGAVEETYRAAVAMAAVASRKRVE